MTVRPQASAERRQGRLRAIVFDLDDTLVDSRRLYTEAYLAALEAHFGRRISLAELIDLRPGPETVFLPATVADHAASACMETFYRSYEALHADYFDGIYPGVQAMLTNLAAAGVKTAVFTGKSRRAWDITARHLVFDNVDVWVFGDEIAHPKPRPDGILLALEQLGASPETAAYVGDSLVDLAAARSAGVLPVAALWSRVIASKSDHASQARAAGGVGVKDPAALVELARRT